MSTVCAIVVTRNHKDRLPGCLDSLLAQSRPIDRIVVIDNASTDGTDAFLDSQYPALGKISLKEYAGEAGALASGMRWAHCQKFDWIWTFDDGIEVAPDCLETMLSFGDEADMIQVQRGAARGARAESCDFRGTLIGKRVTEVVGLPDERYFQAGHDTAYGYIAAQKTRSISFDYAGIWVSPPEAPARNRTSFYLALRNLFLNRDHLTKNGLPPRPATFAVHATGVLLNKLGEAAASSTNVAENALAAIDGLRDGIHKKFDRLPR